MSITPFGARSQIGRDGSPATQRAGSVRLEKRSGGFIAHVCLWTACVLGQAAPELRAGVADSADDRIILAAVDGQTREDQEIATWQQRLRSSPTGEPATSYERLGWAFVAKARRTQDAGYYKLAEKVASVMDARFGATDESRLLRGHALHNLHRFGEAEEIARGLVAAGENPHRLALLCDVLVEQGKLAEAVDVCQRLSNLRPGLEAYSRIAHLRWLSGDLRGATEAMEAAVRAGGSSGAELLGWTFSRLSYFHLQAGKPDLALVMAERALRHVDDYPPALLAQGRALVASGRMEAAVATLQRAAELNPLPEYQWWLADALREIGREPEALVVETALRRHGAASDPRTFALFLATRGAEPALAVSLARGEQAARNDVFTWDAVAWSQAAAGDSAAADAAMKKALAAGTLDARLFLHAAKIAAAAGRTAETRSWVERATPLSATLTPSEKFLLSTCLSSAPVARTH